MHTDHALESWSFCATLPQDVAVSAIISALTLAGNVGFPEGSSQDLSWTRLLCVWQPNEESLEKTSAMVKRLTLKDINKTIVVTKVQLPKIDKHGTGRILEGRCDLSLRFVDREAQFAFDDLGKNWKEQFGPLQSGKDWVRFPQLWYERCAVLIGRLRISSMWST